jgi:hypothetical protein
MNYFITESYLKRETPITANVDVNDLIPFIKTASDFAVQPILGTYFYDYLLAKYNAETLTTLEQTLVGYIKPIVAWQTCSDGVVGLSRQLKNKGLQSQNGDYSNSSDLKEIAFYLDHYDQKKTFYVNRLVTYLTRNSKLFPEFESEENKDSNIRPSKPIGGFNDSIMIV